VDFLVLGDRINTIVTPQLVCLQGQNYVIVGHGRWPNIAYRAIADVPSLDHSG